MQSADPTNCLRPWKQALTHIGNEGITMKLLSIDSNHNGLFLKNGEWASLDSLQKRTLFA